MTSLPEKTAVHDALRAALARSLDAAVASARDAAEGATHEENRAEGIKDMRSTESSYLARGQAMRAEGLADALSRVEAARPAPLSDDDPIRAGALVLVDLEVDDDGDGATDARAFYVLAHGGGTVVTVDGRDVTVIAPTSPMGAALLGKRVDDDFTVRRRGTPREGVVLAIR